MSDQPGTAVAVAEPSKAVANRQPGSIAVINQNNATAAMRALVDGYKFALQFADLYLAAGGIPKKFNSPGEMAQALLKGAELNLAPMQTLEWVFVVNGMPQLEAKGLLGIIEHSGKGHVFVLESSATSATCKGVRPGHPDMVVTWTKKEAEDAGSKSTGGWTDKLIWKAVARIARRMFPDVIGGMAVYDGGDVLDTETLELQPGEANYTPPVVEAPAAPAKPSYSWGGAMKQALSDSPFGSVKDTHSLVMQYLAACVPNYEGGGDHFAEAVDHAIRSAGMTPQVMISNAIDWHNAKRPTLQPIVAPAWDPPTEPTHPEEEPEPIAAQVVEGVVITAAEAPESAPVASAPVSPTMALDDLAFE